MNVPLHGGLNDQRIYIDAQAIASMRQACVKEFSGQDQYVVIRQNERDQVEFGAFALVNGQNVGSIVSG